MVRENPHIEGYEMKKADKESNAWILNNDKIKGYDAFISIAKKACTSADLTDTLNNEYNEICLHLSAHEHVGEKG